MAKRDVSDEGRSVRVLRVGEQVRHVLREILARGDVHDETLAKHLVTVTEVRMSPDLRHATVFVKPLLGKDEETVLKALRTNTAFLQREVAARVARNMRRSSNSWRTRASTRARTSTRCCARPMWRATSTPSKVRPDGQALFLLRQHERGEVDHAAAGRFQLPRARHADDAVHRRDRRSLCGRHDHLAAGGVGRGDAVRRGHRPRRAGD